MFYKYFRETQDEREVSNKALMEETGISGKHLSEFRNGRANISMDMLWKLVEALDRLSPGAQKDFGLKLAGSGARIDMDYIFSKLSPTELLALLGNQRFAVLVTAFAESLGGVSENPQLSPTVENTAAELVEEAVGSVSPRNSRQAPARNSSKEYEKILAS